MLNRAPSVYVPVEPEDNGIALPAILSLIVHGSILAFIALSYQVPKIEDNQAIETSIITPEELASLQADIQANRESLAAGTIPETPEMSHQPPPATNDDHSYIGNDSAFSRGISSIFNRRVAPAPEPMGANDSRDPVFTELNEFPDASHAEEFADATEMESSDNSKTTKNVPKVTTNSNSNNQDQLSATFPSGSTSKPTGAGSSTYSSGDISGALVNLIEPHWTPPVGKVGAVVSVSVTVDENGNVLSVTANTSDPALKESLESAVNRASPLTPIIGTNKRRLKLNFVVR